MNAGARAHGAPFRGNAGDRCRPTFRRPAIVDRKWFVIDAKDQVLGKLAAKAAAILTGKHKPIYTPFLDTGDHVIVINADEGPPHRPQGRRTSSTAATPATWAASRPPPPATLRKKHPTRLVEEAIRGMLPKTKLGRAMFAQAQGLRGRHASATRPRSRSRVAVK